MMSEATHMWANSQRGWLDKLKEARQKREACNELHNRALEEAKTCRAKREQETRQAREEKARERAKDNLSARTKAELRREALRRVGQLYPDLVKIYGKASTGLGLADGLRTLAQSRNDASASLEALTQSVLALRRLPAQPPGSAWQISGDLLRAVLQEYRSIVTDALTALEAAFASLDSEMVAYKQDLAQRLRDFLEKERRWRTWMRPIQTAPPVSRAPPSRAPSQRQAPAASTCPPGWVVDYYYGTACTCRGTSTMSIASAWANYRQYGACR
jgi:hypothetical protein